MRVVTVSGLEDDCDTFAIISLRSARKNGYRAMLRILIRDLANKRAILSKLVYIVYKWAC